MQVLSLDSVFVYIKVQNRGEDIMCHLLYYHLFSRDFNFANLEKEYFATSSLGQKHQSNCS